jgi:hypothetical protein
MRLGKNGKLMKKPYAILVGVISILGLIFILRAQDTATMDATPVTGMSDLEVMLQAVESVPPMPAEDATNGSTFYAAQHYPGSTEPWPPLPGDVAGLPAWDLGDGIYLLDDRGYVWGHHRRRATVSTTTLSGSMTAMVDMNPGDAGDDTNDDAGGYSPSFTGGTPIDTNGLWLQIFGLTNGTAYLSLNNATDQVYEIMTTVALTNGVNNWQTETELWPGMNTNAMPFTVPEGSRTNTLFFRAMDWTGVTENGNTTPDWWFWEYFGTTALSDTNLDSSGNTFLYDYQNGVDPNIINFALVVANNYVNSMTAPVQLNISVGTPSYYAVSVDDTNYETDASWQTYAGTNIMAYLGMTEGWHDVWIGLKGLPSNATQTWQYKRLKLDFTPPSLVVTNPTVSTVSVPMIQLQGYCSEALCSISYDLSNAVGVVTNQNAGITDQFYSTNTFEFTTNYFEALDIPLTNGLNKITLHATDEAGNTTTTNINYTLDYSSKTNPPTVQITWPQNGTQVSGSSFTLDGQLVDPTVNVSVQVVSTNGATNTVSGLVERNGKFWVENLPLSGGTNSLTLTATDAVGNTSVTNISVVQSTLVLTMNPVTPDSDLWKPKLNLTGTISDASQAVWVNGVKGHNNGDGTWSASNVPTTSGGTASFTITAYEPTEQQPDGSYGN